MKKIISLFSIYKLKLLIIFILMFLGSFLLGQSITLNQIGLKGPSGQTIYTNQTLTIYANYTTTSFDTGDEITGFVPWVDGAPTPPAQVYDELYIIWYTDTNASTGANWQTLSSIANFTDNTDWSNGSASSQTITLTVPSPPSALYQSFKIYGAVYGYDTSAGQNIFSSEAYSTSGNTYFNYLEYSDDTTSPVISSVNITDESGDDIHLDYTLSEVAKDNEVFVKITNSDSTSTIADLTLTGSGIASATSHTDVVLQGDALTTDGTGYTVTGTGSTALTNNTLYRIYLKIYDEANNVSASIYDTITYKSDETTDAATGISITQIPPATLSGNCELQLDYTLQEEGYANSVELLIDDDTSHGIADEEVIGNLYYIIDINGEYSNGLHNDVELTVPFTTDDGDVSAIAGSSPYTLPGTSTYYAAIRYNDQYNNPDKTSSWAEFTWDNTTDTPTMTSVGSSTYSPQDNMVLNYSLGEEGFVGSVCLEFWDQDRTNMGATRLVKICLNAKNSNGANSVTLTDSDGNGYFSEDDDVSSQDNGFQNDETYYCYVTYQDKYANDAVTSTQNNISFSFDSVTENPTLNLPSSSDNFDSTFDIQFDIPETGQDNQMFIKFIGQGNNGDSNTHIFRVESEIAGDNRNISDVTATPASSSELTYISGGTTLTGGESYIIKIEYKDQYGNDVAADSSNIIVYNQAEVNLELEHLGITATPFNGASSSDQILQKFRMRTSANLDTLTAITFAINGTATSADFPSGAFHLYESTDATFGGDTEIGGAGKTYASSITFSSLARVQNTSWKYYFLTVDLDSDADEDKYISSEITSSGNISHSDNPITGATFPMASNARYLDGTFIVNGGDYGNGYGLNQDENNKPIFWFSLKTNQATTNFDDVTITLGGNATSSDFKSNGFQLYQDSDSDFTGASAIWSSLSYGTSTLSFSGSDISISTSETYFFLTCDVSATADISKNISASLSCSNANPSLDYANLSGDNKTINGGTHTLPVELSKFNIRNHGKTVILEWTTQTETDNRGFNLYRGISPDDMENAQVIHINRDGEIPGQMYSSQPTDYEYSDNRNIEYGTEYYYWLETIDGSGYTELFQPVPFKPEKLTQEDVIEFVERGLHANYPNPFNPTTTISFYFDTAEKTTLDIYNVKGQHVSRIFDGMSDPSKVNRVDWHGVDKNGNTCSSGVYFYRIKAGKYEKINRMCIIK
jgi:hypothetical protein